METRRRTLLKTASWQAVAVTATFIIAYIVTGEAVASLAIGGIGTLVKSTLYYFHERFWHRVKFGVAKVK